MNLCKESALAREERKLADVIAHYNYELRFRSCGLSRGGRVTLSAHRSVASAPKNPEQEVTLSLHPPLKAQP